jgi:GPH family glycoside/pentoside/hexuronide:cation symporter
VPIRQAATASSNVQAELNRRTRLTFLQKTTYGSGALADGMASTALGFLFFYMTAVCGLSGAMAGASLVIALLVDSVADPLIGSLSDNTSTSFGRRHPWMLVAALPLALSLGLLFSPPAILKSWGLFAYMTLATIGVRVSLSLFAVPHVALGAELSDDYVERSNIVAYRTAFSVIASIAGPLLIFRIFTHNSSDLLHREGYAPFAWVSAAIAIGAAIACTLGTRRLISRLHVVKSTGGGRPLLRFVREMMEVFRNRHFVILFVGSLIYFASQGLRDQLGLHYAEFFWKFSNQALFAIQVAGAAGAVLGFPLSFWLQRHVEKHHLLIMTLVVTCTGAALVPFFRIADILPATGPGLMIPILILKALDGTGQVIVGVTYYSLTADAADEHEYLFHARREGLFFAGLAFTSKAASAVGAFVAGLALDWIAFPTAIAEKGANLHIPARTIIELALIAGPLPAVLMALPGFLVLLIRFNRHDLLRIQEALSERRRSLAVVSDAIEVPIGTPTEISPPIAAQ